MMCLQWRLIFSYVCNYQMLHSNWLKNHNVVTNRKCSSGRAQKEHRIATTQFSAELNSSDWGGSIIGKINHHTTTPPHHHVMTFWISIAKFRAMKWDIE